MTCCSLININQSFHIDPTRTVSIRKAFVRDIQRRFKRLATKVKKKIVEEDCFGLLSDNTVSQMKTLAGDFRFGTSSDKIRQFMRWLVQMEDEGIFEVGRFSGMARGNRIWADVYIQSAYRKGIAKAYGELKKARIKNYDKTLEEGVNYAFNRPFHTDRLGILFERTFSDLKGITDEMDKQISRVLAEGLGRGDSPLAMAGDLVDRVDKIGLSRAKTLARTEVIRAHAEANLNEFEDAGIHGVKLQAEWLTVRDSKVCEYCQKMSQKKNGRPIIYSLDDARGLIPAHPNCLLDGQVKIYTSKGWRQIRNIKAGDEVLTHKGRFRKVIQIHRNPKQVPDAVRFGFGKKQYQKLSLTGNHPVLVNGKWIEAKEIKKGDEINYLADDCKRCQSPIPFYGKYCSFSCNSKDITERQWKSIQHRKTISLKAKRQLKREYKFINRRINYLKKWKVGKPRTLYNLSVAEDESYIANGFVVHNCRCTWIPVLQTPEEIAAEMKEK